jgi:hypothetical protein
MTLCRTRIACIFVSSLKLLDISCRYLSLSWRAPMREPEEEKVSIGIPLPDMTMDQFMDLEDSWSARRDRV